MKCILSTQLVLLNMTRLDTWIKLVFQPLREEVRARNIAMEVKVGSSLTCVPRRTHYSFSLLEQTSVYFSAILWTGEDTGLV